jgi:hypothetical protein
MFRHGPGESGGRSNEEHGATAASLELWPGGARNEEDDVELVAQRERPVGVRGGLQRCEASCPGVVVDDVDPAVAFGHVVHPVLDGRLVGEVQGVGARHPATRRANHLDCLRGPVGLDIAARNGGALGRERQRGGPSLTAGGAGDEGDLVG